MDPDKILLKQTQPDLAVPAVERDIVTIRLAGNDIPHHGIGLTGVNPKDQHGPQTQKNQSGGPLTVLSDHLFLLPFSGDFLTKVSQQMTNIGFCWAINQFYSPQSLSQGFEALIAVTGVDNLE
jgi:hypothetical protein